MHFYIYLYQYVIYIYIYIYIFIYISRIKSSYIINNISRLITIKLHSRQEVPYMVLYIVLAKSTPW